VPDPSKKDTSAPVVETEKPAAATDEDIVDIDAMMRDLDGPEADRARGVAAMHGVSAAAVFICGRRRRQNPCASCGQPAVALCDFPLGGKTAGGTCDRPMCERCRHPQPSKDRTVDYCRVHALATGA
jgi:hypothetical protein